MISYSSVKTKGQRILASTFGTETLEKIDKLYVL